MILDIVPKNMKVYSQLKKKINDIILDSLPVTQIYNMIRIVKLYRIKTIMMSYTEMIDTRKVNRIYSKS